VVNAKELSTTHVIPESALNGSAPFDVVKFPPLLNVNIFPEPELLIEAVPLFSLILADAPEHVKSPSIDRTALAAPLLNVPFTIILPLKVLFVVIVNVFPEFIVNKATEILTSSVHEWAITTLSDTPGVPEGDHVCVLQFAVFPVVV
jgi:hypothetical protein